MAHLFTLAHLDLRAYLHSSAPFATIALGVSSLDLRVLIDMFEEDPTLTTETTVNIKPLGDRVVIRPAQREEVTASGVFLPDTAKEKPQRGTVLAVGPGKLDDNGKRTPLEVTTGATVLYAKYAGTEVKVENEDLLIVSEKDILAIV